MPTFDDTLLRFLIASMPCANTYLAFTNGLSFSYYFEIISAEATLHILLAKKELPLHERI